MAVAEWTQSFRVTSDAQFRTALQGFHAQLTALGLVRLTEGTPINTATVTKPTVANTKLGGLAGSDVWRFDDSLQATAPVFIRFEYYTNGFYANSGATNSDRLKITFQVGTATNGSGSLVANGKLSSVRSMEVCGFTSVPPSGTSGVANVDLDNANVHLISGHTSRLTMFHCSNAIVMAISSEARGVNASMFNNNVIFGQTIYPSQNYLSGALTIERSRDATGAETNEGVAIVHVGYTSEVYTGAGIGNSSHNGTESYFSQFIPFAVGQQTRPQMGWSSVNNADRTTSLVNQEKGVIPIYPTLGTKFYNPVVGLAGCFDFDFELGVNNGISVYGTLRQYRKTNQLQKVAHGRNWNDTRLVMLWE